MTAEAINSVIDNLAAKLAVPASQLMDAIPAFGVMVFVQTLFMSILFGVCLWLLRVGIQQSKACEEWPAGVMLAFISGSGCFCTFLGLLKSAPETVLWLTNPKAWAVHYLFRMFSRG